MYAGGQPTGVEKSGKEVPMLPQRAQMEIGVEIITASDPGVYTTHWNLVDDKGLIIMTLETNYQVQESS